LKWEKGKEGKRGAALIVKPGDDLFKGLYDEEKREKISCTGVEGWRAPVRHSGRDIGVASSCSPQRPTGRFSSDHPGTAFERALQQ